MGHVHDQRGRCRTATPGGLLLSSVARAQAAPHTEWSHHCSACGKCCNSPPQLSVPELLHHQHVFFGCLSVQRVKPPASVDSETRSAFDALASRLRHRLPAAARGSDDVLIATRAFDPGDSPRCPALDGENRCSLQRDRKPAICTVVPLDALRPDSEQHLVLASREAEARYFGADCIAPGTRPGFELVTRRLRVVDASASSALSKRRDDLAQERSAWGDRVFELLGVELFASPEGLTRVPEAGFMTLSLAPVLLVLLQGGVVSRARCVAYLEAQASLADRILQRAALAGHAERDSIRQLAAFARSNARLCLQLKDN